MNKERRNFVKMIAATAGTAVLSPVLAKNLFAAPEPGKVPQVPWTYKKLNEITVAENAYTDYYKAGCSYGVFNAIIGELKKEVGSPYDLMPTEMFTFGEGGVAGTASLCGALNGASAAIFLVVGGIDKEKKEKAFEITRELFNWYEQEALPNYRPKNPKFEIKASVAKSPLCHVSISRWSKATGLKSFSKERSERCGWLTAATAKYTVELLNKHSVSAFKAAHPLSAEVKACRSCHDKGSVLENTRTTMDCGGCHFTGKMKHTKI